MDGACLSGCDHSDIRVATGMTTLSSLTDGKKAHTQVRSVHSGPRIWAQT